VIKIKNLITRSTAGLD